MTDKIIEVNDVSYVYPPPNRVTALRDVNLQITKGEFVALIGPNGSGKTTLTKCIAGLLKPTEGTIYLKGKPTTEYRSRELYRIVGYIFQNPDHQLFKDTVFDDVAFGVRNLGEPEEIVKRKVKEVLERLNLWGKKGVHPFRLGKGERHRVAVAGVLAMEPEVLIVDEPTTGQDRRGAVETMNLLTQLNSKGITILVVTHALHLVATYARRTVLLNESLLVKDGPTREVFRDVNFLRKMYMNPPQIVELGIRLGLRFLPLTIEETKESILKHYRGR